MAEGGYDFIGNVIDYDFDGEVPTSLYRCPSCGAVVADTEMHTKFHAALSAATLGFGRV